MKRKNILNRHVTNFELVEETYSKILEKPKKFSNAFKTEIFAKYMDYIQNTFFLKKKKIIKKKILKISEKFFIKRYHEFKKKEKIGKENKKEFSNKLKKDLSENSKFCEEKKNSKLECFENRIIPDFINFDVLSAKNQKDIKGVKKIFEKKNLENGIEKNTGIQNVEKKLENEIEDKKTQKGMKESEEKEIKKKYEKIEEKIKVNADNYQNIEIVKKLKIKLIKSNLQKNIFEGFLVNLKKNKNTRNFEEFSKNFKSQNLQNSSKKKNYFVFNNINKEKNFVKLQKLLKKKNLIKNITNTQNLLTNHNSKKSINCENQFFQKKNKIYPIIKKIWTGNSKSLKMEELLKLKNYEILILASIVKRKFGIEIEKNNLLIILKKLQKLDEIKNLKRDDEKIKFIFNKFLKLIKSANSKQKNFYNFFYQKFLKKNLDEISYKKNFMISNKKKIIGKKFNYFFIKIFLSTPKLKNLFLDFTYLLKKNFLNIIDEKFFFLLNEFEELFKNDYKEFINRTNMMENFEYSFRLPWTLLEINEAVDLHMKFSNIY